MADQNLTEFVKAALERGESRARIREVLRAAGWPDDQIESAIASFADVDFPLAVPRPKSYGSAREAFLYVVYFSLLGMVATQIGALAFAWIDRQFADDLATSAYYNSWGAAGLRWSVASLLVGYPIFLFLGMRLAAKKRKDPDRRRSRVHAWLTYVTLIFAAGALIGDLVSVVFQFLNGELQSRFLAKAGVVGVISASILWNYSRDVERHKSGADMAGRALALVSTLIAAALVLWAFSIVRSPYSARLKMADEQRLQGLMETTRLIDCHYTYAGRLPESLAAMSEFLSDRAARLPVADGCANALPTDPLTGAEFSYRGVDDKTYEICANFDVGWADAVGNEREWRPGGYAYYPAASERRTLTKPTTKGRQCFEIEAVRFETSAAETPANAGSGVAEPAPE